MAKKNHCALRQRASDKINGIFRSHFHDLGKGISHSQSGVLLFWWLLLWLLFVVVVVVFVVVVVPAPNLFDLLKNGPQELLAESVFHFSMAISSSTWPSSSSSFKTGSAPRK